MEGYLELRGRWKYHKKQWTELERSSLKFALAPEEDVQEKAARSNKDKKPRKPSEPIDLAGLKVAISSGKGTKRATSCKFILRFANGTAYKFRAPSAVEKAAWLRVLTPLSLPPLQRALCIPQVSLRAILICLDWLKLRGTHAVGLFRLAGKRQEIRALHTSLLIHEAASIPADARIDSVASFVKTLLRRLPETILTAMRFPDFMEAAEKKSGRGVVGLVHELPSDNHLLLAHLVHVCILCDRNPQSKMRMESLAVVLGPTLLPRAEPKMLLALRNNMVPLFQLMFNNMVNCFPMIDLSSIPPDVLTDADSDSSRLEKYEQNKDHPSISRDSTSKPRTEKKKQKTGNDATETTVPPSKTDPPLSPSFASSREPDLVLMHSSSASASASTTSSTYTSLLSIATATASSPQRGKSPFKTQGPRHDADEDSEHDQLLREERVLRARKPTTGVEYEQRRFVVQNARKRERAFSEKVQSPDVLIHVTGTQGMTRARSASEHVGPSTHTQSPKSPPPSVTSSAPAPSSSTATLAQLTALSNPQKPSDTLRGSASSNLNGAVRYHTHNTSPASAYILGLRKRNKAKSSFSYADMLEMNGVTMTSDPTGGRRVWVITDSNPSTLRNKSPQKQPAIMDSDSSDSLPMTIHLGIGTVGGTVLGGENLGADEALLTALGNQIRRLSASQSTRNLDKSSSSSSLPDEKRKPKILRVRNKQVPSIPETEEDKERTSQENGSSNPATTPSGFASLREKFNRRISRSGSGSKLTNRGGKSGDDKRRRKSFKSQESPRSKPRDEAIVAPVNTSVQSPADNK